MRGSASPKRIGTRSNATMRSGCSLGSRPDEMRPSSQREKSEAGEQARLPRGRRPRGVTSAAALALLRGAGVPVADPPPLAFAPRLGEHTEAVLGAVGCDARRLADLRRRGIA